MTWKPPDPVVGPSDAPHRNDSTHIGDALDRVLAGLGAPSVDALEAVFERWDELAGPALAALGKPLSIEDGVLLVAVADGYGVNEWRYRQGDVLRRCDEALGEGVVTGVEARITHPR